jgi:hypothetical protein
MADSWYLQKAEQCARLAKATAEPLRRAEFESERRLWLKVAEAEARADKGSQPLTQSGGVARVAPADGPRCGSAPASAWAGEATAQEVDAYSMASLTVPRRCRASKIATPSGPHTTVSPSIVNDLARSRNAVAAIAG